jgi:hypothetical protein
MSLSPGPEVEIQHFILPSLSNIREHYMKKAARTKTQRFLAFQSLQQFTDAGLIIPALPCTITLCRVAPRQLDTDNLAASFKAIQDGVADWLSQEYGHGKDRLPGLTWRYTQEKRAPRYYAVAIRIKEES